MPQPARSRLQEMISVDPATGQRTSASGALNKNARDAIQNQMNTEQEKLNAVNAQMAALPKNTGIGGSNEFAKLNSEKYALTQKINGMNNQFQNVGNQGLIHDISDRESRIADVNRELGTMIHQGPQGPQLAAQQYQQQLLSQIPTSPMAAQMALRNQQNANMQQALAMAHSGQSPSQANMMARNALQAQGMANQQAFGQGAGQAAQEMGRYSQLGLAGTTQGRAQDQAYELMARQQQQQGQALSLDQARAQMAAQTQMDIAAAQSRQAKKSAKRQGQNALLGAAAQLGAGALAVFSDEKVKKNIKTGERAVSQFLDKLDAHKYEYKNPDHGEGEHVSVMAQELEESEIGEKMVIDTPEGKMVDYSKGLPAMLAAQAVMHDRIKKLEKDEG